MIERCTEVLAIAGGIKQKTTVNEPSLGINTREIQSFGNRESVTVSFVNR